MQRRSAANTSTSSSSSESLNTTASSTSTTSSNGSSSSSSSSSSRGRGSGSGSGSGGGKMVISAHEASQRVLAAGAILSRMELNAALMRDTGSAALRLMMADNDTLRENIIRGSYGEVPTDETDTVYVCICLNIFFSMLFTIRATHSD
jgi:hypothetical protein